MTAVLPDGIASFLAGHSISFLSELTGAICVTLVLLLLAVRETQRARGGQVGRDLKLRTLDATTAPLIIVVGLIIIERFLLLK